VVKQLLNKVRKNLIDLYFILYVLFLAKQLIANKKKISFEEAKRLDKNNESMPPWQQLHPSSSGLTSGIGSSSTASSNSGSSSPRVPGTSAIPSSSSSPANALADASSSVTTNLLMDSTNTNCNGNDKTSGKSTTRTK